jgi:hypothetical protein
VPAVIKKISGQLREAMKSGPIVFSGGNYSSGIHEDRVTARSNGDPKDSLGGPERNGSNFQKNGIRSLVQT